MINKENGQIELDPHRTLRPFMLLDDFKKIEFPSNLNKRDVGTGWIWYSFYDQQIGSKYFSFSCAFFREEFQEASIVFSQSKADPNEDFWGTWNEEKQIQKAKIFNDWLNSEIGSKREFNWGIVWAGYDPRSGSSSIGIRYKK